MAGNPLLPLFLLCFLLFSVSGKDFSEISALMGFRSLISDPNGILSSWNSTNSTDHCSWFGVACNSDSRVISLNLPGCDSYEGNSSAVSCSDSLQFSFHRFGGRRNVSDCVGRLKGELSPLIGNLTYLRVLSMPFNEFSGEIPLEIWGLEDLEVLHLQGNLFTGELPFSFAGLRKLRILNLGVNRLHGEIPVSLSKCTDLEVLNLAGNKIRGSIPEFVGSFFKLRELYLSGNELNGSVPAVLGSHCRYLKHLDLSDNILSGGIPRTLGNCRRLKTIFLFSNMLNSEIPRELGQLRRLKVLDISRNMIGGGVPPELGNCVELSVLVLTNLFETWPNKRNTRVELSVRFSTNTNDEGNHFQGSIPKEITTLPKLRVLWAPRATFRGRLPTNWGECKNLEMVNLAQNGLTGEIRDVFEKCKRLIHLDLGSNRLSGELDYKLQVSCMTFFDISQNVMTASIPKFKGMICPCVSSNCRVYDLSDGYMSYFSCKTRRAIHLPISVASSAVIHNFGGNNFTGPLKWLPIARGRLGKQTDYAFLAKANMISGSFPVSIFGKCGKLHGMVINVSKNKISGPIPSDIGSICRSLRVFDVSENEISGPIPESLGDLKFIVALNLSENKLQGQIPASLYQLKYLKHVSLTGNNLSDGVPYVFTHARSLSSVNVSTCNLSQPLDDSANRIQGQQGNSSSQTASNGFKPLEVASIASAVAILSVLLLLVVLFCHTRRWRSHNRHQVSEPKEITVFSNIGVPLLYENITEATGNFNASNCIGNGGFGATYKAEISPGILVAIKKLAIGRLQGVQQFRAEIKALARVRHPNLVTLIGYHASESEMFLIYNYLSGGNLEDFIKERSQRSAAWKVLHKIALDIASVLAYLHHQCAPRVLHRDIKPSNILLDNELNAYLSDFGLSRLLGTSETHATTGVAGTFGYVAPEYAMTCRVTDKADVYSYGVVLLELISDKRALDPSFSAHENGFTIVSWACMLLRNGQAKDVFTAGLWDSGPRDDLVEMLHLAITCSSETLSDRPTMKHVVQKLKEIQPP